MEKEPGDNENGRHLNRADKNIGKNLAQHDLDWPDRHREQGLREAVEAYDRWRDERQPYVRQRAESRLGRAAFYGWSEDKARQYSVPDRADFGAFVRARGFRLD